MSLHTIKTNATLDNCQSNGNDNYQLQVNPSQDSEKETTIINILSNENVI